MKTLYLECHMGAAGDMLMGTLLELHPQPVDFLKRINQVGIPGVVILGEPSVKCGITGTHVTVTINGQEEGGWQEQGEPHHKEPPKHDHSHGHDHNSYHQIEHLIGHLNISPEVKKNALAVYQLIAEAESKVHGVPVHQIHFHEVGEMDAVADIVGVCMLMEELAPEWVLSSPVNTGSGYVRCAHGMLPVPSPAAAHILQAVPVYQDETKGELCTPTGAALLKFFVKEFCPMPVMTVSKVGYGMGKKNFEKANCIRGYLGNVDKSHEEVVELVCNLDDMTPEAVAFAAQLLLEEGALDVFTASIHMKKGRAGLCFTCMCGRNDKEKMLSLMFQHTTTLGIREYVSRRYTLQREQGEAETEYGRVRIKQSYGFGIEKSKTEYEDAAQIAREKGITLQEVNKAIEKATLLH